MNYLWIVLIIVLLVVVVVLLLKPKQSAAPASSMASTPMEGLFDPGLQYHVTNHPVRAQMLASIAAGNPPPSPATKEQADALRTELNNWYNQAQQKGTLKPHDRWGKICVEAAIDSALMGNFAIGNVLVYMPKGTENRPEQWVEILRGGNRMFTRNPQDILLTSGFLPRFDSKGHGEMMVLDAFEDRLSRGMYDKSSPHYSMPANSMIDFKKRGDFVSYGMPDGVVLFTQLNSCQMCLARVGNSGIAADYFLAPDTWGGMQHKICDCAPAYAQMLNRQIHAVANCSPELIDFAFRSFSGPNAQWVLFAAWRLSQVGSPNNLKNDYQYCNGMWFLNNQLGQNAVYDWRGWYSGIDLSKGPFLNCTVKPPT